MDCRARSGSRISGNYPLFRLNIPRILVIPRGAKGFGFILRGAKTMQPGVRFEPTGAMPALQFFEGVDMNGMSMKAGLKPGDFLLEINGIDVRRANHDQVVQLIQAAEDTISLKVITVAAAAQRSSQPNPAHFGTLPARRPQQQQRGEQHDQFIPVFHIGVH